MSKHDNHPTPPIVIVNPHDTYCALNVSIANGVGANVKIVIDANVTFFAKEVSPGRFSDILTAGGGTGSTIFITKDGCVPITHRLADADGNPFVIPFSGSWELQAEELKQLLPPDFSRARALGMNTSFMGGLVIPTRQYGLAPWWDSALSWMDNPADRADIYAAKHANGETHALIEIPNGKPLYDENDQFYSPDKFGPRDWTNGETLLDQNFDNLIKEVLQNNFAFHIAMDEVQANSMRIGPLVAQRLKDLGLTKDGFVMPGYDGVFYGWLPADIAKWGANMRATNNDILLGLEHQPGKLPLGEGSIPPDYQPGGRMKDFDINLAEVNSFGPTVGPCDDTTWQIVGRCIHPYNRPADEPSGDDERPPFVLVDSERGPRYFCYFESADPFYWVRTNPGDSGAVKAAQDRINYMRAYARNLGCLYTG